MKKTILAPSVLSADFMKLGENISDVVEGGAEYIHFDVMDGMFVRNISFGIPVLASVRKATEAVLDVHLMIERPERYIKEFVKSGADIVTFHYEATDNVTETINLIHEANAKAGLSIKPGTPVDAVFPYLSIVDMILVMSVEPGFGGQAFMPESVERISRISAEAKNQFREVDIEVDGGVSTDNARTLIDSGANILVAGSAVFRGNIRENTQKLMKILKKEE